MSVVMTTINNVPQPQQQHAGSEKTNAGHH